MNENSRGRLARLLHEDSDVGPVRDCAEDERDHGDGGEIKQPIADSGIEERRGIVGVGLMSMEKPIGNVRHSHDNLLAQAAWAAHGQASEGTLGECTRVGAGSLVTSDWWRRLTADSLELRGKRN